MSFGGDYHLAQVGSGTPMVIFRCCFVGPRRLRHRATGRVPARV